MRHARVEVLDQLEPMLAEQRAFVALVRRALCERPTPPPTAVSRRR